MRATTHITCIMSLLAVSLSVTRCRYSAALVSAFAPTATRISSGFCKKNDVVKARVGVHKCQIPQSIRLMSSASSVDTDVNNEKVADDGPLQIVNYPHPALRAENKEITKEELDSGNISKITKDMFKLMYGANGVGLAAPQVGLNKRLFVFNSSGDSKKWLDEAVMINPKIVEFSEAVDCATEGCLSLTLMNGEVQRSKWIKVEAVNLKGKKIKKKYKGWEARIFQHELDHINGILFPDRMTDEVRDDVQPRMNEMIDEFGEGGSL